MKTVIMLIACSMLMLSAKIEDGNHRSKDHPNKYCAQMKDGQLVVMHEGAALMADVTLSNGSTIKPDGTILKKDGTTMTMKEGECADKDGKVMKEKPKGNK